MRIELTERQRDARARFRGFVDEHVAPHADRWDRDAATPPEVIRRMAAEGFLGAPLPEAAGGAEMDMVTVGLLHEEVGRGCSSLRSLLTVQAMVGWSVHRWGSPEQKARWLGPLARGESIGAFALSEPAVGSDAAHVETTAVEDGEHYVLDGRKKWITYGQIAHVFLVFARCGGHPVAFLVERNAPGLHVAPQGGVTGTRASQLAELRLEGCRVHRRQRVAGVGFGFGAVAASALDLGRYSVACGCVGIVQACLDASTRYAAERHQFGVPIAEHPLVQRMLTDMVVAARAARLLCRSAGDLRGRGDPGAEQEARIAKYFASVAAVRAARDAVQIHGANGCTEDNPVQRYLRDAMVMEIIEGSTQIQQMAIARAHTPAAPATSPY